MMWSREKELPRSEFLDKQGEITVSSDKTKVGTVVDKQAVACNVCHREGEAKALFSFDSQTRIYHAEKGSLLGLINPISNESSCYPRHPKTTNVLGVLDTIISLEDVEKEKAQIYDRMMTSGVVSVVVLGLLLILLLTRVVNRPIDKLIAATKEAAHGNLDQMVGIRSHDELAELSNFFNNMISELKRSRDALKGWTQTLEHRVQERTQEPRRGLDAEKA